MPKPEDPQLKNNSKPTNAGHGAHTKKYFDSEHNLKKICTTPDIKNQIEKTGGKARKK